MRAGLRSATRPMNSCARLLRCLWRPTSNSDGHGLQSQHDQLPEGGGDRLRFARADTSRSRRVPAAGSAQNRADNHNTRPSTVPLVINQRVWAHGAGVALPKQREVFRPARRPLAPSAERLWGKLDSGNASLTCTERTRPHRDSRPTPRTAIGHLMSSRSSWKGRLDALQP